MENEKKQEFTINGFLFGAKEDIEIAQQEMSAIQYIDKKIENRSGETILSVYQAALEKHIFKTPLGYSYLHDLQKRMLQMGINREKIQPIPLYQVFNNDYKEDIKPVRTVKRIKKKDKTKSNLRTSVLLNIILAILVIVLFFISMTGNTPTVLNYRKAIENEYSSWEQDLTNREKAIREKERTLNGFDNVQ